MVIYHDGRVEELRAGLRTGPLTVTLTLLGAAGTGVASLARRIGPRYCDDGDVVDLEPMDENPLGWMPAIDDEEVA